MSIEDILAEEREREQEAKQQSDLREILFKRLRAVQNAQQPLDDSVRSILVETLNYAPQQVIRDLERLYHSDCIDARTTRGKGVWSCALAHLRQSGKQELAEDTVRKIAFKEYQKGTRKFLGMLGYVVMMGDDYSLSVPFVGKETITRCKQDLGWYGTTPTND